MIRMVRGKAVAAAGRADGPGADAPARSASVPAPRYGLVVPHWPLWPRLATVALLTLCDYLLWNWSLSANHDVLALVSGMTLIPLLIALAWLVALTVARLIARTAQRPRARSSAGKRARSSGGGRGSNSGADEAPTASPTSKLAA